MRYWRETSAGDADISQAALMRTEMVFSTPCALSLPQSSCRPDRGPVRNSNRSQVPRRASGNDDSTSTETKRAQYPYFIPHRHIHSYPRLTKHVGSHRITAREPSVSQHSETGTVHPPRRWTMLLVRYVESDGGGHWV